METIEQTIHFDFWFEELISELQPAFLSHGKHLNFYPTQAVGHISLHRETLDQLIRGLLATINLFAYETQTIDISTRSEKHVFQILIEHEGEPVPSQLKKQILRSIPVHQSESNILGNPASEETLVSLAQSLSGHFTTTISKGVGISYSIQLPLLRKEYDTQQSHLSPANKEESTSTFKLKPSFRYRLLIVEDNTGFREILKLELSDSYDIDCASNGLEGIEMTENNTYDVIISDILMPEMNGLEFAESVRASEKHREIPFLFLTSLYHSSDILKGFTSGADAYITKTTNLDNLRAHILGLLSRNQFLKKKYAPRTTALDLKERVDKVILQQLGNSTFTVETLASILGMSRSAFYRAWAELEEENVNTRIMKARLNFSRHLIEENDLTIAQIAFASGFSNPSYFTKSFKKFYGFTPKQFNQKEVKM